MASGLTNNLLPLIAIQGNLAVYFAKIDFHIGNRSSFVKLLGDLWLKKII